MSSELILDLEYRHHVIEEIESDENVKRKQESLKRFEIDKDRLEPYVYNILQKDLSHETVEQMRVMSSINLAPRITTEKSSVYKTPPKRTFINSDDKTDELLTNLYHFGKVNKQLKLANRYLNLQDQCSVQVIPKDGILKVKVLQPHHFDVIPSRMDPEKAEVYILSQYDKNRLFDRVDNQSNFTPQPSAVEFRDRDRLNQNIADEGDWQSRRGFYVWWSDELHFMTDHKANIINPQTGEPFPNGTSMNDVMKLIENPIQKLPFVDVKEDTDFEYWQRFGNSTVDFAIQMALILSDTAEVNRLQGFAQPIISAVEPPVDMKVGANTLLYLKKTKGADQSEQPNFEFASPNPDLNGSIDVIRTFLSLFQTAQGVDPSTVTADGKQGAEFQSGIDRLLSNIEKFESSQDQFDLFKEVEGKIFELFRDWLNAFAGVTENRLIDELTGIIPEDVDLTVEYKKPTDNISAKDKYDLNIRKVEDGAMSMLELIMDDRDVTEDEAREILEKIVEDREDSLIGRLLDGNRDQDIIEQEPEAQD